MRKTPYANQEWIDILEEELAKAVERDPDGYAGQNLKKAIKSIQANRECLALPTTRLNEVQAIRMETPEDARALLFVGKATVKMLERGLRKRASEASAGSSTLRPTRPDKRPIKRAMTMPAISSEYDKLDEPVSQGGHSSSQPDPKPRASGSNDTLTELPSSSNLLDDLARASKRPCIPTIALSPEEALLPDEGTPEAALLIALYERLRDGDQSNWAEEAMSVAEFQKHAVPYIARQHITNETVWHTKDLETLTRRRLFGTKSVPVVYHFTMSGLKIAHAAVLRAGIETFQIPDYVQRHQLKLSERDELDLAAQRSKTANAGHAAATGKQARDYQPAVSTSKAAKPAASTSRAPEPSTSKAPAKAAAAPTQPFEYFFVTRSKTRSLTSMDADIEWDDSKRLLYKIEFRTAQSDHPVVQSATKLAASKSALGAEGPCSTGFVAMDPPISTNATGFSESVTKAVGKSRPALKTAASAPAVVQTGKRKRELAPTLSSSNALEEDYDNAIRVDPPPHRVVPAPIYGGPRLRQADLVVMRPHEYKVVLVLDHRERQTIAKMEAAGTVDLDSRGLSVADAIWVARRLVPTGDPEADELVLDVAIERKRISDLVSSIKSGRYDDQKARMKTSGITRLLYLLEDDKEAHTASNWEKAIWTVKTQCQVRDGFVMLFASNFQKVIALHTRLHTVVKGMYQGQTIYGIRHSQTDRSQYLGQLAQLREGKLPELICPTYKCFQELNDKQRTVRSEWAAMMWAQVHMSAEKVQAFVERFPTPIGFYEEIKARRMQEETEAEEEPPAKKRKKADSAELWIMKEAGKEGSRGIKQKLSSDTYKIWTQLSY